VAQTKRKRTSKHRGNAAGTVEARGRTSRPLSTADKKKLTKEEARIKRLNSPPTWKSSFTRAGLAAIFMFAFLLLTGGGNVAAAALFAIFALAIYVPAGYYLERLLWRRRMAKQAAAPR
jgi:hypothetical protein